MNKYTYDYTCHMPKEGARQRVHMALDYILELTSPDHSGVRYWVPARCVFQSAPEPLCCLLLECDVSSELVVMSHVVDRGMARILPQNRAIGLFKFNIVLLQLSILTSVMKTWTGWQGQIIEAGPAAALFRLCIYLLLNILLSSLWLASCQGFQNLR